MFVLPKLVRRYTRRTFSEWTMIQLAYSCTFILFLKLLRISIIVLQTFFTKYVAGFNECVVNFKDKSSNSLSSLHLLIYLSG